MASRPLVDAEQPGNEFNPLWIVAIGMACLFGSMAILLALG